MYVVRYCAGKFGGKFYGLYSEVLGLRNFMFSSVQKAVCKVTSVVVYVVYFMDVSKA